VEDLYAILGVGRHASAEEIRRAYLAKIRVAHPDLNPGGEEQAKRLNVAYETLSDPRKRHQYEESLAGNQCPFCGMRLPEGQLGELHVARHLAEMAATGCRVCGRLPAEEVSYRANAGFILWRQVYGFEGPLCRSCGKGMFREFQARNIVRGPWGLISILAAAWYLLSNLVAYWGHHQGLGEPYPQDEAADRALRGRPVFLRPAVLLLLGLVVGGFLYAANSHDDNTSYIPTSPSTNYGTTRPVTYDVPDTPSWEEGACVDFSGDWVEPVSCSSGLVDGRVVDMVSSSYYCPASTDYYVTLSGSSVACISSY
jgi:hypothetical protein